MNQQYPGKKHWTNPYFEVRVILISLAAKSAGTQSRTYLISGLSHIWNLLHRKL